MLCYVVRLDFPKFGRFEASPCWIYQSSFPLLSQTALFVHLNKSDKEDNVSRSVSLSAVTHVRVQLRIL